MTAKTVLVTGTSSGIGASIARRLLDAGYAVLGVSRRDPPEPVACTEGYRHLHGDLSRLERIGDLTRAIGQICTSPDAIVCNAGCGRFGSLEEFSHQQIRNLVDLNLTSQVLLVADLLPAMKRRGNGRIVIIGSESGLSGGRRGAVYSATKFALRGFAQSLRQECARNGIGVTIINPGMVASEFFDNLEFRPGSSPQQHLVPDDVADAVLHCLRSRFGTVVDEINLSPLNHVLRFGNVDE